MSGGRATIRKRQGKATVNACGDVAAVDPIGLPLVRLFSIELKRGYNRSTPVDAIDRLPGTKHSEWEGFVEQARAAADNEGTPAWMVIHRRDRRQAVVYMEAPVYDLFAPFPAPLRFCMRGSEHEIVGIPLDVFVGSVEAWSVRKVSKFLRGRRTLSQPPRRHLVLVRRRVLCLSTAR